MRVHAPQGEKMAGVNPSKSPEAAGETRWHALRIEEALVALDSNATDRKSVV